MTQIDDKIRYAKWKAADIAKAFREGRAPTPGPANQEVQDSPVPNIAIEAASPEQSIPADSAKGWPGSPSRFDSDPMSPGNWSTVATPGTADHRGFDPPISPHAGDPRRATVSDELEGLPEEFPPPEESQFGDPHIRHPTQPSPEHALPQQPPPQPSEPGSVLPSGVLPTNVETYTAPAIETAVGITPQPPIQSYQQISQPTPTSPIPTQQQPFQTIRNVAPPPPPTAPAPPPQLTPKQIAQAQKHCRYAISALDYEDFERARKDLLDALRIIGG